MIIILYQSIKNMLNQSSNHKKFYVTSLIVFILSTICAILYIYSLVDRPEQIYLRFIFKPIPIILMILNVFVYFNIYRIHTYALLTSIAFAFCMLGDILLTFYIPPNPEYNNIVFFILGGLCFFISKIIMSINFTIYPFNVNSLNKKIKPSIKKLIIIGGLSFLYSVSMSIVFILKTDDILMKFLLPFYFIIMGIQVATSALRIKGFEEETLKSQIFDCVGTLLFTIADNILFWSLFICPIPGSDIISIIIYWISMYLIMLSVVRSETYELELYYYY